ncbi:MAG: ectoine/hydroxyectoine ABC transporter permease subunit EhuC [Thermoleophilaceae bacterium]
MSEIQPFLPFLLKGALVTAQVTLLGLLLALAVAFVAGLGRLSSVRAVRWAAGGFIEVFRGTSVVVQLFWFFFALPIFGLSLTPMLAAVLALGLNGGAYAAEVVRGAVLAVPREQLEAATALNLSRSMRMRRVILPQALPLMLPPFGNVSVDLLKASALVSLVTVSDLTFRAQQVRASTGETALLFGLILAIYFALAGVLALFWHLLERRFRMDRRIA